MKSLVVVRRKLLTKRCEGELRDELRLKVEESWEAKS